MVRSAARELRRHIKDEGITLEVFARAVGTSKSAVSMWRDGKRTPGLTYALAIERETGIPASAWLKK